ncbi:MAG: tRNA (adenosine(37)-N6)-threonylcarbamoyltransferase complex dimerization subunit type 1 TsaB [Myxococcota bacterium]
MTRRTPETRRTLALDTSCGEAVVALLEGTTARATERWSGRPAEGLRPALQRCIAQVGWSPRDLDLVVVGRGPGSFTGTRVALAMAKGLAISLGVDVVGVSSLLSLARSAGGDVSVLLDAGRGEVYGARVSVTGEIHKGPLLGAPAEIAVALGDPLVAVKDLAEGVRVVSLDPIAVALEGAKRFDRDGSDDAASLEPIYVRGADAALPATPLRVGYSASSSSKSDA